MYLSLYIPTAKKPKNETNFLISNLSDFVFNLVAVEARMTLLFIKVALYHFFIFTLVVISFSCCSGSFSPWKISGFKHSFEYLSPYALLKTPLQLENPISMATSR